MIDPQINTHNYAGAASVREKEMSPELLAGAWCYKYNMLMKICVVTLYILISS